MSPAQLVMPVGILAFAALISAVATGLAIFKFRVRWVKMQWHAWSAYAAITLAIVHVILIKLFY
jgi:hypothetical protein